MKSLRTRVCIFFCIFILILTSCAETPTNDIVTNKNDTILEDQITSSDGTGIDISSNTLKTNFTNSAGTVTFNIDADIVSPTVKAFPVLKAIPHFFTSKELAQISTVICGDNPIYEYSEVLTRSELEAEILAAKQYIGNKDYLLEYYDNNEETVAYVIDIYEERIANMEAEYNTAPDSSVKSPATFQFYDDSHYLTSSSIFSALDGVMSFKATSNINGIPMFIWAAQRNDHEYVLSNIAVYPYSFRNPELQPADYYQTTPFSDNDLSNAIKIVEQTLLDMGLTDWQIYSYGIGDYSAIFKCTPKYYGIQMSPDQGWNSLSSDSLFSPSYTYSNLEITISNNQIIEFWFEGPLDISEILTENVKLLPFEDVTKRIYEQLEISWTPDRIAAWIMPDINIDSVMATINITNIELTLVRTNIKNDPDSYYILPAWIVYGSTTIDEYELNKDQISTSISYANGASIPLLVINAIDGSVIDMSQGY